MSSNNILYGRKTNDHIYEMAKEILSLKEKKQYDEAIAIVNELINRYPNNAECYFLKGSIFRAQKEFGQLIENYDIGLNLDNSNAVNFHTKGFCALQGGFFEDAIFDFSEIINHSELVDRSYVLQEAYAFRAIAKCCIGQWDDVESDIQNMRDDFIVHLYSIKGVISKKRLLESIRTKNNICK